MKETTRPQVFDDTAMRDTQSHTHTHTHTQVSATRLMTSGPSPPGSSYLAALGGYPYVPTIFLWNFPPPPPPLSLTHPGACVVVLD